MTDPRESNLSDSYERLLELLSANATEGLHVEEAEELERLVREYPEEDREGMDRAAAALELALGLPQAEGMPSHLADRVMRQGQEFFAARQPIGPTARVVLWRQRVVWGGIGWVLAASLLVATWLILGRSPPQMTVAQRRADLLNAPDVVRQEWAPPVDADFAGVRGDVVWSDARQEGYLRLRGMPANDPQLKQYQLWIVDPGRDRHPVDGGVFDVSEGADEVIVPVSAKLAVSRPQVFAITREQPGGVVVSKGPLLVVSKASGS